MKRLLLVEDQEKDLQKAAKTAYSLGIDQVDGRTTLHGAKAYLEQVLEETTPAPDAILLDLNLGYGSGYELLRFWHITPQLAKIPLIVWSILGDENREMCKLFKVSAFVGKWEGEKALQEALANLGRSPSAPAGPEK